jgi:hypothetical protein
VIRRPALLAIACLACAQAPAQAPADDSRFEAALGQLQPQRAGTVDAYVVVAGLDTDPVFDREAREAGRVLAQRFGAEGRTITLAEDEGFEHADAAGTPAHLAAAIAKAESLMDPKEDVLVLYTTSHGTPRAGLFYKHAIYGSGIITPAQLSQMLAAGGAQNRLVILQACFSGQFVPALANPKTVVVTAASAMRSSFGCTATNDWTFFGHALINQSMRTPDTFVRQVRRAFVSIMAWEDKLKIEPSLPQVSIGSDTAAWLAALDAQARPVPAAPVGKPPLELER